MLTAIHGVIASSKNNGILWNIGTATYASGPYNVGTQATNPYDVVFGDSGNKMYVFDVGTDTIYQYSLGTPYEAGTASYDSKSLLITGEDSAPYSIAFSSDGTKLYVGGDTTDSVHQYSLSVAWDVSTGTADSVSKVVAAWPTTTTFKPDGTEMYIMSGVFSQAYQYTLSTAWDLSTAGTASASGTLTGEDSAPRGLAFSSDGTKMYMAGDTGNAVYQYTLSTAWDITSKSYDSVSFDISGQETSVSAVQFDSSGTKMYITGIGGADEIYQYTLSTAWDLSTAKYTPTGTGKSFDVSTQSSTPSGIELGDNGTKMYITDYTSDTVYQYTLSTAYDISSASYASKSKDVSAEQTDPYGVAFSTDGTIMYISGWSSSRVHQYTLSTAWDVSTASYASKVADVSATTPVCLGVTFNDDGTSMYVTGSSSDAVSQYTLSTAWDVSTASYASKQVSVAIQDIFPYDMAFNPEGTQMFVAGVASDTIYQYSLSTAWDVSTATYDTILKNVQAAGDNPEGVDFNPDGSSMYVISQLNATVHQYTL